MKDGEAQLCVVEVPIAKARMPNSSSPDTATGLARIRKMIVNTPAEGIVKAPSSARLKAVEGMKVIGVRTIVGPYVQSVKGTSGSVATIKVQEGMWEVKRGVKVDGGERRKVQVRRKRLLEERKTTRK